MEHVAKSSRPPGGARPHGVQELCLSGPGDRCSSGRRSHPTSGWRRTMPERYKGASSKMASKGWPSHTVAGWLASARWCGPGNSGQAQVLVNPLPGVTRRRHQGQHVQVSQLNQVSRLAPWRLGTSTRARPNAVSVGPAQPLGGARGLAQNTSPWSKPGQLLRRDGLSQHDGLRAARSRNLDAPGPAAWRGSQVC